MANGQAWYTNPSAPLPYKLCRKIHSNNETPETFQSLAFFPWKKDSLESLWKGAFNTDEYIPGWHNMIEALSDAIVVGGEQSIHIFYVTRPLKPVCVRLPTDEQGVKLLPTDCVRVAWALASDKPFEPLIVFSYSNLLYIYNVRRKGICGYLRGHGGAITSIAVHPTNCNLICSTSRDYSTRIYDLHLPAFDRTDAVHNPCWPPGKTSSYAGAAHGLHMADGEGGGRGRCIMVLLGGRSGGHQAAVLGATFHPRLPLIATCGLDRLVKIWFVNVINSEVLAREDKPLFSSSRVHRARILSVTWLQHDILVTHSAPALLRKLGDDAETKEHYIEPGMLVIWRWLGMDRFFPPQLADDGQQKVLRGCASDYQESCSFKVISAVSFPPVASQHIVPIIDVIASEADPLVLFATPKSNIVSILNLSHVPVLEPPPFPVQQMTLADQAERMQIDEKDTQPLQTSRKPIPVSGWNLPIPEENSKRHELMACAMGLSGQLIAGVGSGGTVWIWGRK